MKDKRDMKFFVTDRTTRVATIACAAFLTGAARAQDYDAAENSGWFARVDAVARFNIKATLEHKNPTMGPGVFNNGFVLPDAGGSSTLTWNWGYTDASQIVGSDIVFQRYDNAPTVGKQTIYDDPTLGGEFVGGYRFNDIELGKRTARISLQIGYGYTEFSQSMNFGASGSVTYSTSSHSLNGIIPPSPPYSGTPQGPGPLISLPENNSTTITSGAATSFTGGLDATFQTLRMGPAFEVDLTKKLSMEVGFGYAAVYADASLNYTEVQTFTNPSVPTIKTVRTLDKTDWEPGIYFELLGSYQFTRRLGAFVGADYQYNNSLKLVDAAHKVTIDLSSTFAAKAGIRVLF